jgi:APA family basic amino acid/polyamine antiporter
VCTGVLILRHREPERPRAFRTPLVPIIPILGILSCVYLMCGLPEITWLRFGGWLIVGIVIYLLYGYRHSRLHPKRNESFIDSSSNFE